VIIPTIGRPEQLADTLAAVDALDPAPTEVIVVDQSQRQVARTAVMSRSGRSVTVLDDDGIGAARARNRGAAAATCDLLLFTDDDCHPRSDWVDVACRLHTKHLSAVLTGAVRPGSEDEHGVPSVRVDPAPHDYTGSVTCSVLYSGNMVVTRLGLLAFGGFDERFPGAGGEDNDLCYRWLRAGLELRYEPELVVTHDDWRTPAGLEEVRHAYAVTQGMFYAKHLRARDLRVLRFLANDFRAAVRNRLLPRRKSTPDVMSFGTELRSIRENWHRFGPTR
jgi:GT2 family glycosyltransferase